MEGPFSKWSIDQSDECWHKRSPKALWCTSGDEPEVHQLFNRSTEGYQSVLNLESEAWLTGNQTKHFCYIKLMVIISDFALMKFSCECVLDNFSILGNYWKEKNSIILYCVYNFSLIWIWHEFYGPCSSITDNFSFFLKHFYCNLNTTWLMRVNTSRMLTGHEHWNFILTLKGNPI